MALKITRASAIRIIKRRAAAAAALTGTMILIFLFMQTTVSFAGDIQGNDYEKVIAHGGGVYKGYETTNSVEALKNAISNGYKIIELDMELSADRRIIMLHDWDRTAEHYFGTSFQKKISQSKFLNLSVYGKLEVMNFDKLANILDANQDIKIVTDTKGDNLELLTKISEEYPDYVNRIMPQIYDYDQWRKVKDLGYSGIIFTLYAMHDLDTDKLISFVKENEIYAVAMPDYLAERGYCRQLAEKGITVYVHPVSNFEDARQFMSMGAYGVYTGTLLPEEFMGLEKDYYLTVTDESGTTRKLTDDRFNALKDIEIHGIRMGETVFYSIDGSHQRINEQTLLDLSPGKHKLTVQISWKNELLGSLDYILWKDGADYRILHKKYEYRLDAVKQERDFKSVMSEGDVQPGIIEILEHSLIAKKGEYAFYSNGNSESYMNGEEFLSVQTGRNGKLLLPLNTTVKHLGATSVTMSKAKDITIDFNRQNAMVMVDSCLIRKGFQITKIKNPVVLYLNKAMAAGEFYQCITGRSFIESGDMIIILPSKVTANKDLQEQLLKSAGKLFSPN